MLRRSFLAALGLSFVTVTASTGLLGCGDDDPAAAPGEGEGDSPPPATSTEAVAEAAFPQGIASGDPSPTSVVLWARLDDVQFPPTEAGTQVSFVVATDEALTTIVARGEALAGSAGDNTIRAQIQGLTAATRYFYRFHVGEVTSRVGRTKTAPETDADVPVRFAFAACQDFVGRRYHAWRALVEEGGEIDFVLFLGDYIYETAGDPRFQTPDAARAITLPDGLTIGEGESQTKAALTLADYRSLYRQYRSDPSLREAHRLYPFVTIWDDHEFANDCWQDHATDFDEAKGDEKSTDRRNAASRAWFEYQPAAVVDDEAKAFPDRLTLYRQLRFGKHVDLIVTDQRQYRSDHVIPEGPILGETGKITENSSLGSRNFVLKKGFDPIEAANPPTMLGAAQKAWFLDAMKNATGTWKVWANEVQLWQMALDLSPYNLPEIYKDKFYFSCDQWDGYRTERKEILGALSSVSNVVVCTGDIHAFYAAELHVDFDAPSATPIAVEYVTAGISSSSTQEIVETTVKGSETLTSLGLLDLVPKTNEVLLSTNPHLRYSDATANGIAIASVSADSFAVTFLRVADVRADTYGVTDRSSFRTTLGSNRIEKLT
jgi:alkaline phosphatase D